jgi:hypothetical protein
MKLNKIFLLVVAFLLCNSCNNLDLKPLDKLTADAYYKTSADFDGALFAAYSSIQDFWGTSTETLGESAEFWKITDVITDDVDAQVSADQQSRDADVLNIRPADKPYAAIYTQLYEGIYRANIVLEHIDLENELTADEKKLYTAEAKFLRAFFHFMAVQLFGTPPLVTETFKSLAKVSVPNATKDELFKQILADYQAAFEGLPEAWNADNTGRATKWAAMAYIGKVNVWKGDMPAAITAFESVIADGVGAAGKYGLIDTDNPEKDLEDVFAFDNENNMESIFEIQFGGPHSDDNVWVFDDTHSESFKASQGITRSLYWDAGNYDADEQAPGGKNGWWVPSQNLVDEFEPNDARLHSFIYMDGDTYYAWNSGLEELPYNPHWSVTGYVVKKYTGKRNVVGADFSGNNQANFNNERFYRFAELKLLYAEALLAQGRAPEATTQINDLRDRAGLGPLGGTATLADLQHEKRVELCFEGHRWNDITRWGIGGTLFPAKWQDKYVVFPFPQSEIDRTRGTNGEIKQNAGY